MLRSSPGKAPLSSNVAAKELIINEGAIIPHSQIMTSNTNSRRNFAPKLRLANHTEKLLLWRVKRRLEATRGCKAKALSGDADRSRRLRRFGGSGGG
jgi:hypothetical protein